MATPIKTGALIHLREYDIYLRCDAYKIGDAYVFKCYPEPCKPQEGENVNAVVVIGQGIDWHDAMRRYIICTFHTVVVFNWG